MKVQLNCGACMIKQALVVMQELDVESREQIKILNMLIEEIPTRLGEPTPSHFQSVMLMRLSELLNIKDLYLEDRIHQNKSATEIAPQIIEFIKKSPDPLYFSAIFSVEGNGYDPIFMKNYDIQSCLDLDLPQKFYIDHFDLLLKKLSRSKNILYIVDNAGEIVFDRIFIEQCQNWRAKHKLPPANFVIVAKSGPILNDALVEDAITVGLNMVGTVIESGSNYLGLPAEYSSKEIQSLLDTSELIISKGQANFETLESNNKLHGKIFFLLKAKCAHISEFFHAIEGSLILYHPQ